ncbi:MAG: hypothetical protein KBE23_20760 [Chloroflexi bacterium]|nr:hypothetical protein [Chloroflexota bacterium]
MQSSFLPLIDKEELEDAWKWLFSTMKPRPENASVSCVYDPKHWMIQEEYKPLYANGLIEKHLSVLFLTSEFGEDEQIYGLTNFGDATSIDRPAGLIDRDVANVIQEEQGFRDSLAEHLAFWVRLANEAQNYSDGQKFAGKLPHIQSRDKGPDGLFIVTGQSNYVELQSVKSSTKNPRNQVGTRSFRINGKVHDRNNPKQLEEFWLTANENWGSARLQRELSNLCRLLQVTNQQLFKMSLQENLCSYNAIVVANEKYASEDVFEGYEHITPNINHRIATYISSEEWKELAEKTRQVIIIRLNHLLPKKCIHITSKNI